MICIARTVAHNILPPPPPLAIWKSRIRSVEMGWLFKSVTILSLVKFIGDYQGRTQLFDGGGG